MKNITLLLLLAGLSGCFSRPREKTGLEGTPLPYFNLLLTDSTTHFNTNSIPEGKPIILFYFSPTCPYCRAEMKDIVDNVKKLDNIQFYILTTASFPLLKKFYNHYHLNRFPNVIVAQDYTSYFGKYFNARGVPYLAIYDAHKRLKQVFIGKTDISDIKDIVVE